MAKNKKYQHLLKPLLIQDGPEGIYPEPRIWMESKDLEGFNGHFSYGFIKEAGIFHPIKGSLVHPYDECLVFAGIDTNDFFSLGAEISILLGEEQEEHIINEPSLVVIPKGMPHGPVTVRKVDKPCAHYLIGLSAEFKATFVPQKQSNKTSDLKYGHLIKKMKDAEVRHDSGKVKMGPGNADNLAWFFSDKLEGLEVNVSWGHYSSPGIWHRGAEGVEEGSYFRDVHSHPEEEALIFVGLDPNDLSYFGAECQGGLGEEEEIIVHNVPSVVIAPSGLPHGPAITRWVDKPFGFIVFSLSGAHESTWAK